MRLVVILALAAGVGVGAAVLLGRSQGHVASPATVRHSRVHARRRPASLAVALEAAAVGRLTSLGLPVFCGGRRGRYVALTFDDGPGRYTRLALRILRTAGARATFFLVGRNLARWPGFVRPEAALGALGDHTWTHPYLPSLGAASTRSELADTQRAIERSSGRSVSLFRPPYGARNGTVDSIARSLRMLQVLWSVDSFDWKGADWRGIAANVLRGLRPGSIVLLHDNRGQTIRALKFLLLPALRRLDWRLVSVPELLALDPPSLRRLRQGIRGCLR